MNTELRKALAAIAIAMAFAATVAMLSGCTLAQRQQLCSDASQARAAAQAVIDTIDRQCAVPPTGNGVPPSEAAALAKALDDADKNRR